MQSCWWLLLRQTTDELPASDGDHSDAASADTDDGSGDGGEDGEVRCTDDDDEDTDADGDDDEFVDAGDEVEERAPWVTERRHSGDGEVRRHTRAQPFYGPFPGLPGRAAARRNLLLDFMVQGKKTEANAPPIRLGSIPSGLISDPPPSFPHFYARCPSCRYSPIYPGLGQAPYMLACIPSGVVGELH